MTRIVLIRHAATDVGGRLCGSTDVPLSAAGRAQLERLRHRPPRQPTPDALLTSTLGRAQVVASVLARAWGLDPRPAGWAREIHCGQAEGMPFDRLQREFPVLWARNEVQADDAFAWPSGETCAAFRARVLAGLRAVARAHVGGRVVVVTHAGVVAQVLGAIRGRPASIWSLDRPDPFTATEVACVNDAPRTVLAFNDPDWY